MRNKYFLLFVLLLLNSTFGYSIVKTWIGNNNSNWNTAGNWSPNGAPAAGDDIIINDQNYTGVRAHPIFNNNFTGGYMEIRNGAVLTIDGGSLTFSGTLRLEGSSTASPRINHNSGTFTINGNATWAGHSNSIPVLRMSGGKVVFSGTVSNTLNAAKILIEVFGGDLEFYSNVFFNNTADKLEKTGGRVFLFNTLGFINKGIYNATGGETIINGNNSISDGIWNFFNLRINAGRTLNQLRNISVRKDWNNQGTYSHNNNSVTFNGSANQQISGSSVQVFHNLIINNSHTVIPQITLNAAATVLNNLNLVSGVVNQNENPFTIGSSETILGSLSYTSGWFYGGNFNRWIDRFNFHMLDQKGHFPVGSEIDYRPFWLRIENSSSSGGVVTVRHYAIYPTGTIPASHLDPTWAGGTWIQAVSQSYWAVSYTGFTGNGSFSIRYGGHGFGTNNLNHVGSTLISSVVANHSAATSVRVPLEANRVGLAAENLKIIFI
jgi:hypothetical protein